MYIEANAFYGLKRFFTEAGYYETPVHQQLYNDLKAHIQLAGIFAFTGAVGSGKTTLLNRIQNDLEEKNQVIVSRSLTTEKRSLTIQTLFLALFYDLSSKEKSFKIPTQSEKRERELIELIKKHKKPVVLFIDEAHDVHGLTLIGLKRLVETVASRGGQLSIVLAGHPKLRNALSTATMEEIGSRTKIFSIDLALDKNKEKYIAWLITQCLDEKKKYQEIITEEAIKKLASALQTPLQIQHYLGLAVNEGHIAGEKTITEDIITSVLLADLNSLEARLARSGYQFGAICDLLRASPKETREFLQGKSNSPRKSEFMHKIREIGIEI